MTLEQETVCVIGLGYIGLPTAALLASRGFDVHGVDLDARTVESINAGRAHIVEPDLAMLVEAGVQTGRLRAHSAPVPADVFLVCVPTPLSEGDRPDLRHIHQAAETIAPCLRPGVRVILESTSPPGTTSAFADTLCTLSGLAPSQLHVAHAPERVLPGRILRELVENDRIVGGVDEAATQTCAAFYERFVLGDILRTDARTAETVKLVENAYRDVNIAFANELSLLSDALGLDVWEVIALANRHPRVNILRPGPGVGGHCIAVDPYFLIDANPERTTLIATARRVNALKPRWVIDRTVRLAEGLANPRIACLGLTYKPDVDDLRGSPAVEIVRGLRAALPHADLRIVEPNLPRHPDFALHDLDEALFEADLVLILVAHRVFKALSRDALSDKIVIDPCGALSETGSP